MASLDRETVLEIKEVVREAVAEAVPETLLTMGIDPDQPLEMQKDFVYLRDWRLTSEAIKKKGILAAVGLMVTGGLGAMYLGLKHYF